MIEVRRPSDGELCGHVRHSGGDAWESLTVFGGRLNTHDTRDAAEGHVLAVGLASLAERWMFRPDPSSEWQVVCIQEADPGSVRIALDYYSLPGVPTLTLTPADLAAGASLVLDPDR